MRFPAAAALLLATFLHGMEPRKSAAEYPAQSAAKDSVIGADYTVRTFMADRHSFTVEDYLLVEVAVYPARDTQVNLQRFSLRVNGKNVLSPQTPGMVAASLKYPDWSQRPSVEMSAGPVIFGRPQPVERFPGDRRDQPARRQPAPGASETNPIDYNDLLTRSALPEGPTKQPVAGYIYFAYDGKLKSIRSVELLVDGVPLKLR